MAQALELEQWFVDRRLNEVNSKPWPPRDVMAKLLEATEHCLTEHNCDKDGWEQFVAARDAARELIAKKVV